MFDCKTLRHKPTRKLYDSQGLTIVELENMASTLAYFHFYYIEDFVAFVGQLAPRALPAFMSIFNFGIYVDVAVFLVLVGLKIDSNNPFNHSWAQVFIPLWVIDGIGLAIAIYSCYSTRQTAPIKSASFIAHTSSLVLYIMFVLIQVFIVLKLDGYVDWRVMQVLAPFFVWQVLSYLVRLSQSSVTECKAIYLYHGLTEYILAEMAPPIMWIAFAATLADKLDGVHAGKLYTTQIFVPSYVYAALVSAYSFIYWAFASKDSKKRKLPYSLETYLSMLAALAFCVMLAYRLDNWTSISLFYIFIPLFFILVNIALSRNVGKKAFNDAQRWLFLGFTSCLNFCGITILRDSCLL